MTLTLGMEKRMKGWPGEPQMEYDVLMADGNAAANAGRQITDVIFDFGNVLIYWDPAAVMTPRYSDGLVEHHGQGARREADCAKQEGTPRLCH